MRFFVGLHQPSDAHRVDAAFISVNRIRRRKSGFAVRDWIMDSGAFSVLNTHGYYPDSPEAYAALIRRWSGNGNMLAAVSQDYMCEPFMLEKTGMTVSEHQRLTVERYDAIKAAGTGDAYLMPVLQGYAPRDYVHHIRMYGDRLALGMWVGVGSVCKRNSNPETIAEVLSAIKRERPDLRLHGFGVKKTALADIDVLDMLETADSMAWSFSAASQLGVHVRALSQAMGRRVKPKEARPLLAKIGIQAPDPNSVEEAIAFASAIEKMPRRPKQISFAAWIARGGAP